MHPASQRTLTKVFLPLFLPLFLSSYSQLLCCSVHQRQETACPAVQWVHVAAGSPRHHLTLPTLAHWTGHSVCPQMEVSHMSQ
jgi:hypothetical protein